MPVPSSPLSAVPARRRSQRGFTLIEILVAASVLTIALLGHASTVVREHTLSRDVEDRGHAIEALQKFVERVRADPDWTGLYARLLPKTKESTGDTGLTWLKEDTRLTTYAATAYYSDLVMPTSLGTVTFLIQVPTRTEAGVPALRENMVAPRYGLPYDLNGDGTITGTARDADYRALPIVVRIRWQRAGQVAQEIVYPTWLRGER
jgi:prepilin-type N-terminal cleavage/methylation domain-containing protein